MLDHITDFIRPASVDEAIAALKDGASVIAGGTDLLAEGARGIDTLVDLTALGLDQITGDGGGLKLGATVTLHQVAESAGVAAYLNGILSDAARGSVGSLLRTAATVGGNIATAAPRWDLVTALLAADAVVTVVGKGGQKELPLDELLVRRGEHLAGAAILTEIALPPQPSSARGAFVKLARNALDVGIVTAAVKLDMIGGTASNVRIAVGCLAEVPFRAREAEAILEGRALDAERVRIAAEAVSEGVRAVEDVRAAADYRKAMAAVMVRRALDEARNRRA